MTDAGPPSSPSRPDPQQSQQRRSTVRLPIAQRKAPSVRAGGKPSTRDSAGRPTLSAVIVLVAGMLFLVIGLAFFLLREAPKKIDTAQTEPEPAKTMTREESKPTEIEAEPTPKTEDFEDPWLTQWEEEERDVAVLPMLHGTDDEPASVTPMVIKIEEKNKPPDELKTTAPPAEKPKPPPTPYLRLFYEGFDSDEKPKAFEAFGEQETTMERSPGSLRAIIAKDALRITWTPTATAENKPPPIKTGEGTRLYFQCRTKDLTSFKLRFQDEAGATFGETTVAAGKNDEWRTVVVELDQAGAVSAPAVGEKSTSPATPVAVPADKAVGRVVWEGKWDAKEKKASPTLFLDDLALFRGGAAEDAVADVRRVRTEIVGKIEQKRAYLKNVTAAPEKDGYLLTAKIVASLENRFGGNGKQPPTVLVFGTLPDGFLSPLIQTGGPDDGGKKEKWNSIVVPTPAWRSPEDVQKTCGKAFEKDKARWALLLVGGEEVIRGRIHPLEYYAATTVWLAEARKWNMTPTIVSPVTEKALWNPAEQKRLEMLGALLADLAKAQQVPLLDATGVLERTPGALVGKKMTKTGGEALNEPLGKLWATLNRWVWKLGPAEGQPGVPGKTEHEGVLDE